MGKGPKQYIVRHQQLKSKSHLIFILFHRLRKSLEIPKNQHQQTLSLIKQLILI